MSLPYDFCLPLHILKNLKNAQKTSARKSGKTFDFY
jgi:hypothetical protein